MGSGSGKRRKLSRLSRKRHRRREAFQVKERFRCAPVAPEVAVKGAVSRPGFLITKL